MTSTAIQLYTLDGFDVSEPTKVKVAAETDVDGVEMVFNGLPTEATLAALDETDLEVAGLSVGIDDLRDRMKKIETACESFDCKTVILGYLDESYFESRDRTLETADLLTMFANHFRDRGLRFLYHNHRHEFASLGDQTHFALLVEATDDSVEFELDVGWIGVGGANPYTVIRDIGERTISVHLKDMRFDDEAFVNLGEGDLDVERAAQTAIEMGVEWLIYEHEDPDDPVESVVTGASRLQKFKQTEYLS